MPARQRPLLPSDLKREPPGRAVTRARLNTDQVKELNYAWQHAARIGRPLNAFLPVRPLHIDKVAPAERCRLFPVLRNKLGVYARLWRIEPTFARRNFNDLSSLGATAGGGETALRADVSKLLTSIADVGNPDGVVLIASPSQAIQLSLQPRANPLRVYASRALTSGTVVALDINGLISAFSPLPRIEASGNAVADFNDSTPSAISTVGSPNTAGNVRSAFQQDCVIIRMILSASWVVRPGSVAFISSTSW